ncbi:MAG: hypothetical protein OXF08_02495 [Bacteroidetes bacterium]|nr:hypothetical protein [Bacteroidota bacterium]
MKSTVNRYEELQDGRLEDRQDNYQNLVNDYYDLTTNFYEFGWGAIFSLRTTPPK